MFLKPKNQKTKKVSSRAFEIPTVGIIDNIVISKREAWAYYVLSEKPFDFLSTESRLTLANATISALSGLCESNVNKVDCHLLISTEPFNSDGWVNQMITKYPEIKTQVNPNIFADYVKETASNLYENTYIKRISYLGVKLTNRGSIDLQNTNPLEFGFKDAFRTFLKSLNKTLQFSSIDIDITEENRLRDLEKEIFRILSNSSLQAKRPSAEELLLTNKRRLYPSMPISYIETSLDERVGLSDILLEHGGEISHHARWLKITQFVDGEFYTGYRTALSFSRLPKDFYYPANIPPFLYRKSILPFTVSARFTMIPNEPMKKELGKKKLEMKDELKNLAESDQDLNSSVFETAQDIKELEDDLQENKYAWLSGSYRIIVEAPSQEQLKDYVTYLKREYAEDDFVLTWTSGDQLSLLKEEFLGSTLQMKDFNLTTNLALLGVAGINLGTRVGDPVNQTKRYTTK